VEESTCNHQWAKAGMWNGKDPETGRGTGGAFYKCKLCGKRVTSLEEVKNLGGTVDKNVGVFGRPINNG
jgi:hypothetical protein